MWANRVRERLRAFYRALFPAGRTPLAISGAVFIGVFIGVLPTLGFALPLTALVATICRVPTGPALVSSFVATPPTLFLFFYPLGYLIGRKLTHPPPVQVELLVELARINLSNIGEVLSGLWAEARGHVLAFFLGMTPVALVTGVLFAVVAYVIILRRGPPEGEESDQGATLGSNDKPGTASSAQSTKNAR